MTVLNSSVTHLSVWNYGTGFCKSKYCNNYSVIASIYIVLRHAQRLFGSVSILQSAWLLHAIFFQVPPFK